MATRCLSVHAGYRCQHSGACCSGVFSIPAEPSLVELVTQLQIPLSDQAARSFRAGSDGGTLRFLAAGPDGACVFFGRESRLCALHSRGGTAALPTACRHFPRVFLHDGRGMAVSLSHFCPTAAASLVDDRPLTIVGAEPPLALDGDIEAFDAVEALPPLLRPDMLMDLEGFDAWERAAIAVLARDDLSCDAAMAIVDEATERIRLWNAGETPLAVYVNEAFAAAAAHDVESHGGSQRSGRDRERDLARLDTVDAAGLGDRGRALPRAQKQAWEQFVAAGARNVDGAARRYLAAKLFGNRIAYESRGLRSMVEWLRICLAVLRNEAALAAGDAGTVLVESLFIEAIRAADLTLVHRTDTSALARNLVRLEQQP